MPFGIKDPSKYIEKRRDVMVMLVADACHGCTKPAVAQSDGLVKIVPAAFPYLYDGERNAKIALLCPSCYAKQSKMQFNTFEDFASHLAHCATLPAKGKSVKKASGVVRYSKSLSSSDIETLKKAFELIGAILQAHSASHEVPEEPVLQPSNDLDDDDILNGMTEEQKIAMDIAVAQAEERTKQVPQESWNKSGAPNGW